ncbi:hypothetical protein PPYR_12854 [Photinus pyralis]|uniref:Uncharacterized protein n=1 Tax=Photinus pyralis TaxID=7054 RepID=A0A5N4A7C8_PHOPY|nr:hypothetical protein PPYR_12854 [Photinus pyralis]
MVLKYVVFLFLYTQLSHGKRTYGYYHQHQRTHPQQLHYIGKVTHYYSVHHYFMHPEDVSKTFDLPGETTTDCEASIDEILCIPNSYLICLSNGTLLCVSDIQNVVSCGFEVPPGIAFKEECAEKCDPTVSNTDICMPCIANITLVIKKFVGSHVIEMRNGLCLTVLAEPHRLSSTVHATLSYIYSRIKHYMDKVGEMLPNY